MQRVGVVFAKGASAAPSALRSRGFVSQRVPRGTLCTPGARGKPIGFSPSNPFPDLPGVRQSHPLQIVTHSCSGAVGVAARRDVAAHSQEVSMLFGEEACVVMPLTDGCAPAGRAGPGNDGVLIYACDFSRRAKSTHHSLCFAWLSEKPRRHRSDAWCFWPTRFSPRR